MQFADQVKEQRSRSLDAMLHDAASLWPRKQPQQWSPAGHWNQSVALSTPLAKASDPPPPLVPALDESAITAAEANDDTATARDPAAREHDETVASVGLLSPPPLVNRELPAVAPSDRPKQAASSSPAPFTSHHHTQTGEVQVGTDELRLAASQAMARASEAERALAQARLSISALQGELATARRERDEARSDLSRARGAAAAAVPRSKPSSQFLPRGASVDDEDPRRLLEESLAAFSEVLAREQSERAKSEADYRWLLQRAEEEKRGLEQASREAVDQAKADADDRVARAERELQERLDAERLELGQKLRDEVSKTVQGALDAEQELTEQVHKLRTQVLSLEGSLRKAEGDLAAKTESHDKVKAHHANAVALVASLERELERVTSTYEERLADARAAQAKDDARRIAEGMALRDDLLAAANMTRKERERLASLESVERELREEVQLLLAAAQETDAERARESAARAVERDRDRRAIDELVERTREHESREAAIFAELDTLRAELDYVHAERESAEAELAGCLKQNEALARDLEHARAECSRAESAKTEALSRLARASAAHTPGTPLPPRPGLPPMGSAWLPASPAGAPHQQQHLRSTPYAQRGFGPVGGGGQPAQPPGPQPAPLTSQRSEASRQRLFETQLEQPHSEQRQFSERQQFPERRADPADPSPHGHHGSNNVPTKCAVCSASRVILICSQCHAVGYCSSACRARHEPSHKLLCGLLI